MHVHRLVRLSIELSDRCVIFFLCLLCTKIFQICLFPLHVDSTNLYRIILSHVFSQLGTLTMFLITLFGELYILSYLNLFNLTLELSIYSTSVSYDLLNQVSSTPQPQLLTSNLSIFSVFVLVNTALNIIQGVISEPELLYSPKT